MAANEKAKKDAELASEQKRAEKMRQYRAEKEAEKAKDRRFQLFNTLIGAFAGAIITLIIEHCILPFLL